MESIETSSRSEAVVIPKTLHDTKRPEKSVHFMLPLCGYINLLVSNITIIQDNPIKFKI